MRLPRWQAPTGSNTRLSPYQTTTKWMLLQHQRYVVINASFRFTQKSSWWHTNASAMGGCHHTRLPPPLTTVFRHWKNTSHSTDPYMCQHLTAEWKHLHHLRSALHITTVTTRTCRTPTHLHPWNLSRISTRTNQIFFPLKTFRSFLESRRSARDENLGVVLRETCQSISYDSCQ